MGFITADDKQSAGEPGALVILHNNIDKHNILWYREL